MKLIMSIVHRDDADGLLNALTEKGHRATRISTTGGFLREGNATIMVGSDDAKVEAVLSIVRANCRARMVPYTPLPLAPEPWEVPETLVFEVEVGGATVFVVDVAQFHRF